MTSTSSRTPEFVLLDQMIQDFQGVLLSIHAACQPLDPREPVRGAIEASLDHADGVLTKWRDRVRSADAPDGPDGSGGLV
jgi:hypothetical protein